MKTAVQITVMTMLMTMLMAISVVVCAQNKPNILVIWGDDIGRLEVIAILTISE